MSSIVMLARLLLVLVFLVAGVAKLIDLKGSQQALRDFGVPDRFARPSGVLLPLSELTVALALILPATVWSGAVAALALLLLFVVGIAYNLVQGRQPECHCFGQLHSAPAGWSTLIRNLMLAAVAAVILIQGRSMLQVGVLDWLAPLTLKQRIEVVVGVVLVALLIGAGWLLFQVMSQQGRLLLRIEALEVRPTEVGGIAMPQSAPGTVGLPVGSVAPSFTLPTLASDIISLPALRALGKPIMLVFSDPGCGPCNALLPEIGRWQREHPNKVVVALISRGTVEANRSKVSEHDLTHVFLQHEREVAIAYQVSGTPAAVLIRRDGTIGSPLAQGADAIRELLNQALSSAVLASLPMATQDNGRAAVPRPPDGPRKGKLAPDFHLPNLTEQTVSLSDFRGEKVLLLFWRPSCGFCQRMLADLKAWEMNVSPDAPRLLVISTDSVESNQAMGLRSQVLLDQAGMSVGSLFGATGTPMAVLVDAEGKIASELAAGAPAVLALAGANNEQFSGILR